MSTSRTLPPLSALHRYNPQASRCRPSSSHSRPVQSSRTPIPSSSGRPGPPPAHGHQPQSLSTTTNGPSHHRPPPPAHRLVYYRRPTPLSIHPISPPRPPSPTGYRVGPKTFDPLRPEGLYKASKGAQRDLKWHKKQSRDEPSSSRRPPNPQPVPSLRQPLPPPAPPHRVYTTDLHQPRPVRYIPYQSSYRIHSILDMPPRKKAAQKAPVAVVLSERDQKDQIQLDHKLQMMVYNLTK